MKSETIMTEQITPGGRLQRKFNSITLTILTAAVVWGVKTLDQLNRNYAVMQSQRQEELKVIDQLKVDQTFQRADNVDLKGRIIRVETILSDKLNPIH